jgi:hypothetical protein
MGPRLGVHLTLRLLLHPVVADRLGGIEGICDLRVRRRLQQSSGGRIVDPDAGVAVGLETTSLGFQLIDTFDRYAVFVRPPA